VRFGLALHDEDEIHSLLQDRHPEWLDRLSYLDWTCEMGVQVALPSDRRDWGLGIGDWEERQTMQGRRRQRDNESVLTNQTKNSSPPSAFPLSPSPIPNPQSPIPNAKSPLAYLQERRSFYRLADDDTEQTRLIVQQFVEGLHGYYRQWRKLPPTTSHPIRLAFLIERDCVSAFQNCVKNARRTCHEGRCVVLGPWPPYSFVETNTESLHQKKGDWLRTDEQEPCGKQSS
jgi:hypothetical protein